MSRGPRDAREAAVAAAFAAHAAAVTALAARVLGDADAARDVCQDAFVRLHARFDEVRGDPGPWVRAVAWRLAFDALRRRRREAHALDRRGAGAAADGPEADATPSLDARDEGALVRGALGALSGRQREVLLLRVVEGETFPAVARALEISEGSAKVHLRRALDRLRGVLGARPPALGATPTPGPAPTPATAPEAP